MTAAESRINDSRPLVMAIGGAVASAAMVLAFHPWITTHGYAFVLSVALTLGAGFVARIDARTFTLPNRYVAALCAFGVVQAIAVSIGRHDGAVLYRSGIAAVVVFGLYTVMGLAGWFGFGDAKFAGALTLTAGISAGLAAIYIVPLAIGVSAFMRILVRGKGKKHRAIQAHGPAIALSAVVLVWMSVLL